MIIDNLENGLCIVSYDKSVPCITMEWHGYSTNQQFKAINIKILEHIIAKRATKMICDVTEFQLVDDNLQAWLNEKWLPQAHKEGLKAVAMINSRFYFSRVTIEEVIRKMSPDKINVEYFDKQSNGKEWLKSLIF